MTLLRQCALIAAVLGPLPIAAQTSPTRAIHKPSYIVPSQVDYAALIPEPPKPGSDAEKKDLAAVHQVEKNRTAADIAAARKDADEEDIFIFADVMGQDFRADKLPITAAFSAKLRNESGVINPDLKAHFHRARPFVVDSTLHRVCEQKPDDGYPSGHSMVGWITGLTLAEMMPERAQAVLQRAQNYAMNRVVCGVHYPSDIEASHQVALVMYGNMAASSAFKQDLMAARTEIRQALHLPAGPAK